LPLASAIFIAILIPGMGLLSDEICMAACLTASHLNTNLSIEVAPNVFGSV
jgi:hypothetical protein